MVFPALHITTVKGHCHRHFLAFLVKQQQNNDYVLSTMQQMLLERKRKDI